MKINFYERVGRYMVEHLDSPRQVLDDWTLAPHPSDPTKRIAIDFFTYIGEGGFARVYKAYDVDHEGCIETNKPNYALKEMKSGEIDKKEYDIQKQYIPTAKIGDKAWLLMPYFEGKELQEAEELIHCSFSERVELIFGLVMRFNRMHNNSPLSKGVVAHRDIKPSNMLLLPAATKTKSIEGIQPIDFGLSNQLNSDEETAFRGSLPFIAPELFVNSPYDLIKTDIYSLTATLLVILGQIEPERSRVKAFSPLMEKAQWDLEEWHQQMYTALKTPFNMEKLSQFNLIPDHYQHDIKRLLISFLNRMQAIDPNARPSSDDVLSFFTSLNVYCKASDKPMAEDFSLGTQKHYLNLHAAKLALLTLEVRNEQKSEGTVNSNFMDFDFSSEPAICEAINLLYLKDCLDIDAASALLKGDFPALYRLENKFGGEAALIKALNGVTDVYAKRRQFFCTTPFFSTAIGNAQRGKEPAHNQATGTREIESEDDFNAYLCDSLGEGMVRTAFRNVQTGNTQLFLINFGNGNYPQINELGSHLKTFLRPNSDEHIFVPGFQAATLTAQEDNGIVTLEYLIPLTALDDKEISVGYAVSSCQIDFNKTPYRISPPQAYINSYSEAVTEKIQEHLAAKVDESRNHRSCETFTFELLDFYKNLPESASHGFFNCEDLLSIKESLVYPAEIGSEKGLTRDTPDEVCEELKNSFGIIDVSKQMFLHHLLNKDNGLLESSIFKALAPLVAPKNEDEFPLYQVSQTKSHLNLERQTEKSLTYQIKIDLCIVNLDEQVVGMCHGSYSIDFNALSYYTYQANELRLAFNGSCLDSRRVYDYFQEQAWLMNRASGQAESRVAERTVPSVQAALNASEQAADRKVFSFANDKRVTFLGGERRAAVGVNEHSAAANFTP